MSHSACSLNRSSKNGFLWSNKLKKLHSNPLTSKESPVILFTLRSPKDVWPCFFVPHWILTNWKLSPGARGVCVHKVTLTPPHCPYRAVCLSTALPNSMWGVLTIPVCSGSIYLRVNSVNTSLARWLECHYFKQFLQCSAPRQFQSTVFSAALWASQASFHLVSVIGVPAIRLALNTDCLWESFWGVWPFSCTGPVSHQSRSCVLLTFLSIALHNTSNKSFLVGWGGKIFL